MKQPVIGIKFFEQQPHAMAIKPPMSHVNLEEQSPMGFLSIYIKKAWSFPVIATNRDGCRA